MIALLMPKFPALKEKIKSKGKVEDIIDEDIDALESFVEKQQEYMDYIGGN